MSPCTPRFTVVSVANLTSRCPPPSGGWWPRPLPVPCLRTRLRGLPRWDYCGSKDGRAEVLVLPRVTTTKAGRSNTTKQGVGDFLFMMANPYESVVVVLRGVAEVHRRASAPSSAGPKDVLLSSADSRRRNISRSGPRHRESLCKLVLTPHTRGDKRSLGLSTQ